MDNNDVDIEIEEIEYELSEELLPSGESAPIKPGYRSEVYDWLQCVITALLFCILMFVFVARLIGVIGPSMEPTLHEGDKVFISNLFFEPKRGDVVIFRKDSFRYEPLVKRVIATEGETVDIDFERGIVMVDGVVLEEDYIAELTHTRLDFDGPVTVPEGQLFVLGDNRNRSQDSRLQNIGLIDERYVMGKVYFVVLPFSDMGRVH